MHKKRQSVTTVFRHDSALRYRNALQKLQTGREAVSIGCKTKARRLPFAIDQLERSTAARGFTIKAAGARMSEHVRELSAERPEITSGFCRPSSAW
jgi:hypothetical protein